MGTQPVTLDMSKAQPISAAPVTLDLSKAQPIQPLHAPTASDQFGMDTARGMGLDADRIHAAYQDGGLGGQLKEIATQLSSGLGNWGSQTLKDPAHIIDPLNAVASSIAKAAGLPDRSDQSVFDKSSYSKPNAGQLLGATANVLGGAEAAEKGGRAVHAVNDAAGKAANKINSAELRPEMLKKPVEPARPVEPHVSAPTPLDDATLGKFDKNLTPEARQTLRQHAGDTVPAGSSVRNQLVGAVKPINDLIQAQGLKLNKILHDAGDLKSAPESDVTSAIGKLKQDLPGGTEDTFGKAIDKEITRADAAMKSTSPVEVNNYIRELDKRINSYTAPEEALNTPADAADAARVTIRRALRDKLNAEIPETKQPNEILGRNLEVRASLRKKLGEVAHDATAADSQYRSEFQKGLDYLDYEKQAAQYGRNMRLAGKILGPLIIGAVGGTGWEAVKHLFGE